MLGFLPFVVLVLLDFVGANAEGGGEGGLLLSHALRSKFEALVRRRDAATSKLRRREAGISQVTLSGDGRYASSPIWRCCALTADHRILILYSSYFTLMTAGNITFRVALDTASADFWLVSSACSSSQCRAVPAYPLTYHSPSFGIINDNATVFNLSFADGSGEIRLSMVE